MEPIWNSSSYRPLSVSMTIEVFMSQKVNKLKKFNSIYSLYDRKLSNQEVFDINSNLMGFMNTLLKMEQMQKEKVNEKRIKQGK